jgi:hypothetical protein
MRQRLSFKSKNGVPYFFTFATSDRPPLVLVFVSLLRLISSYEGFLFEFSEEIYIVKELTFVIIL